MVSSRPDKRGDTPLRKKICVPMPYRPEGGRHTFVANLKRYLKEKNIPYTEDMEDRYDVLFTNSWVVPYEEIKRVKARRPRLRVVHRVDGSAQDYGRFDDADYLQARVNMLADVTIFQSVYSKYSTTNKFTVVQGDGPIIYNPVDVDVFCPDGPFYPLKGETKVCNAAFSMNQKKGTWKIGELAQKNPDVFFVLCGHYPDLPRLPNIQSLGHLGRSELAAAMRSCDIFLHLAENDPCPNVVLEAMASGLPVLYKDSGGTPELVGECGVIFSDHGFRQQLAMIVAERKKLSTAARERAVREFSPHRIFPQYLEAMLQAKRHSLPTRAMLLRLYLKGYPVVKSPLEQISQHARVMVRPLLRLLHGIW